MNREEEKSHLHELLEQLGIKIDVLKNLEATLLHIENRYVSLGRVILFGSTVIAVAVVLSLALGGIALNSVSTAQHDALDAALRADTATAQLQIVSSENRTLIKRLEEVALDAQLQGRRTDEQQCREINSLRKTIRSILVLRERSRYLAERFRDKNCNKLPNMKPVTP